MSAGPKRGRRRKPYQPPRLAKVHVSLDEIVLVACKMGGGAGPFPSGTCSSCGSSGS